jgi:phage tail sheath gpL-like
MASTLVITVKSGRPVADNRSRFVKDASDPRGECRVLEHLFERLKSGLETGASFTVSSSANAPVQASGTVTAVNASISANDTVTVAGTVLTAKSSGATGAQFNKGGTSTITATNLAAAINANCTVVSASSVGAVVTVTCNTAGAVGNFVTLATSNGTGFTISAATLASGAGGAEAAAVSYSRGL